MTTPDTPERAALMAEMKRANDAYLQAAIKSDAADDALLEYDAAHRPDRRSGRDRRTEAQ